MNWSIKTIWFILATTLLLGSPVEAVIGQTPIFINELHYDNEGADADEFIEIAGPAGTDLAGWRLVLYNGNGGAVYGTIELSGTLPYEQNNTGTLSFARAGIQNGAPDGLALVDPSDTVIQFLSYEGTFTAVGGPADGMVSVYIGVSESGITGIGDSLQLIGTGYTAEAFRWSGPLPGTAGRVNTGQAFDTAVPTLLLSEDFDDPDLAGWRNISMDSDQENRWTCSETLSNAEVNGFGNTAAADEWLITPPLDLDAQDNERLSFLNQTGFADSGVAYPQLEVLYSTDYDGGDDPTTATWTPLTGISYSPENSNQYVDSGLIDLSWINGSAVYFAFHYTSSGTSSDAAARWCIDKVRIDVDSGPGQPEFAFISEVQGAGPSVTNPGVAVTVEAVVIGDYQAGDALRGFFIQEEDTDQDGDPATSEGIFVYCGACAVDVAEGQIVRVTGVQEEFFGMSQIDLTAPGGQVTVVDDGNNLSVIEPVAINLPATDATNAELTFEPYEGMLVKFLDRLTATEYFQLERFGQIVLSADGRQRQFTQDNPPDASGYRQHLALVARQRIVLDDLNNSQNIDPVYHPQPGGFSVNNFIRGGYTVDNLTGVLHWSFAGASGTDAWRVRPQISRPVVFTQDNTRQMMPDAVGGSLHVASFNVLNYFTTINLGTPACGPAGGLYCRGAHSIIELERQTVKIVAALTAIDADIVGLIELENNSSASLQALVDALNLGGAGPYSFVDTGTIGSDAIKVGLIYKADTVTPVNAFKILDAGIDPEFLDTFNRPVLIQSFEEIATGERLTVAVNHLKSKGSDCEAVADPDTSDGQGNCNLTRTRAAKAMANYLAGDPTRSDDPDVLIIGDLNAYAMEDPITALKAAGYSNLLEQYSGEKAYSYVFDGQWGYMDSALANASLLGQVTGASVWHINSDEASLLDYNDTIQDPAEQPFEAKPDTNPLFEPNPFRASDHDPIIVGLSLKSPPKAPQCNGVDATIYVKDGRIVGGPNHGQIYHRQLLGTPGADVIVGSDAGEVIIGYAGDDTICAAGGNDLITGGPGEDMIFSGDGRDLISGNQGKDFCDGGNDYDFSLLCETKANIP